MNEMERAVARYRKAATALRGIFRRIDRGQAGTTRATEYAIERHRATMRECEDNLVERDKRMAGLLWEEHSLAQRIQDCPVPRPELKSRLAAVRRTIDSLIYQDLVR